MYIWVSGLAPAEVIESIDLYCSQHDIHIQDQRLYSDQSPIGWQIRCDDTRKLDFLFIKFSEWVTPQRGL